MVDWIQGGVERLAYVVAIINSDKTHDGITRRTKPLTLGKARSLFHILEFRG